MDKIINIESETYALIRKYVELKNSQDNLSKNYETRILELLSREINLSEHGSLLNELEEQYPTTLQITSIPFNVRDITLKYLKVYAYLNDFITLDEAICDSIKKEMSKKEFEKETKLTGVVNALYLQFQKRIEKMEEEH